eukprot:2523072-Pyramimonas_sp.AAC.1
MPRGENNIVTGSELLPLTSLLADALHASGATALRPLLATSIVDKSHKQITPPTTYDQPGYVEQREAPSYISRRCSTDGQVRRDIPHH